MSDSPGLSDAIAAIWTKHVNLMFARLNGIESALAAAANNALDATTRAGAHSDAHKLAGALGTFGLHEGTESARRIEYALAGDGAVDVMALQDDARRLRAALESGPAR